jgi:hypothetical protein
MNELCYSSRERSGLIFGLHHHNVIVFVHQFKFEFGAGGAGVVDSLRKGEGRK